MADYYSCGYTVQIELINLSSVCMSSGGLSHIPNKLIHSTNSGQDPMCNPVKKFLPSLGDVIISNWLLFYVRMRLQHLPCLTMNITTVSYDEYLKNSNDHCDIYKRWSYLISMTVRESMIWLDDEGVASLRLIPFNLHRERWKQGGVQLVREGETSDERGVLEDNNGLSVELWCVRRLKKRGGEEAGWYPGVFEMQPVTALSKCLDSRGL